jgi:pimeloyl-ACP methyl ester carboxylesterase
LFNRVLVRDLNRPVYAIDTRNHGDSSHSPVHNYIALAEDIELFIAEHKLESVTLIGHSMGAKIAMTVALRQGQRESRISPQTIANLIPVDNAPVDAALHGGFAKYMQGMRRIEDSAVTSLDEADKILQDYEESLPVRQFLLTNLIRDTEDAENKNKRKWQVPLKYLQPALNGMGDFPFSDPDSVRWEGPALFVRGTKSPYVADEMLPTIGRFFPGFRVVDVEAGHWVISEKPEEFREGEILSSFTSTRRSSVLDFIHATNDFKTDVSSLI